MKKNKTSQCAFLNPRAILSFILCALGVLLALIASAVFPGAAVLEGKPLHAHVQAHGAGLITPPPMPTGPRPHAIPKIRTKAPANPRPALPRTPLTIDRDAVHTTFVVNNTGDTHNVGPGCADSGGNCTLRAAVEAANADAPNVDAITLPAGTYVLTLGELPVTNSMLISGAAGGTTSIIDGNAMSTIFHISGNASLELANAVIRNAVSTHASGYGGAVYVENGTLTAGGVTLTGNSATYGGGIYVDTTGSLWLTSSTLTANHATSEGGGVYAEGPSNFRDDTFGGADAMDGNTATYGGGLYVYAAALIENTNFTNNNASSEGGGLYIDAPTIINGGTFALNGTGDGEGNSGYGGAIYQSSYTSTINGTTFSQNGTVEGYEPYEGGAIYMSDYTMQLINTTFDGNQAGEYGGAIYNDESMQIIGATFSNNTAGLGQNYVGGGVIYNEYFLSIQDATFTDNVANAGPDEGMEGGLIYNSDYMTMVNVTISGTQNMGYYIEGGIIYNSYYLNMDGVTVTDTSNDTTAGAATNTTYVQGGGIYNSDYLNVRNSSFDGTVNLTGPAAPPGVPGGEGTFYGYVEGGVLYQDDYASLDHVAMTNTTSTARGTGGYIEGTVLYAYYYTTGNVMNITGSTATADDYIYGAVYVDDQTILSQATIAQHTATLTGTSPSYGSAAGVWFDYGPASFTNVTIANNSLTTNGGTQVDVGGISVDTSYAITLTNCTVANNSVTIPANSPTVAATLTGGIYGAGDAVVTLKNTIVASNTNGDCRTETMGDIIRSAGHNLDSDGTCGFAQAGDLSNTDAMLSPIGDNGGDLPGLLTLLPQMGSPVIDAGDDNACPATDERSITRPQGPRCDIGAVEFVTPAAVSPAIVNISTRLSVGVRDNVLIGGFIVAGTEPKRVIVRALGPSLNVNGVPVPGRLANPTIALYGPGGQIAFNDDWRTTQEADIIASGMMPTNDLESAIIATLPTSPSGIGYTAIMRGVNDTTGVGMVEVYDLNCAAPSKLANISTRGSVGTGDNVMIGGVMVMGTGSQRVIVRAIGPSLASAVPPLTGVLANPMLELHDMNGMTVAMNDNWRDTQQAEIIATGLAPTNDMESAIVTSLPASTTGVPYTAVVRGVSGTTGIALVEVYSLTN